MLTKNNCAVKQASHQEIRDKEIGRLVKDRALKQKRAETDGFAPQAYLHSNLSVRLTLDGFNIDIVF